METYSNLFHKRRHFFARPVFDPSTTTISIARRALCRNRFCLDPACRAAAVRDERDALYSAVRRFQRGALLTVSFVDLRSMGGAWSWFLRAVRAWDGGAKAFYVLEPHNRAGFGLHAHLVLLSDRSASDFQVFYNSVRDGLLSRAHGREVHSTKPDAPTNFVGYVLKNVGPDASVRSYADHLLLNNRKFVAGASRGLFGPVGKRAAWMDERARRRAFGALVAACERFERLSGTPLAMVRSKAVRRACRASRGLLGADAVVALVRLFEARCEALARQAAVVVCGVPSVAVEPRAVPLPLPVVFPVGYPLLL